MIAEYTLLLKKGAQNFFLRVKACDTAHAQAQASDICRALGAEEFQLTYGNRHKKKLSKLFEDLAFNNFTHKSCCIWEGSFTNNVPCIYIFGKRIYVRDLIVKYLDIISFKEVSYDKKSYKGELKKLDNNITISIYNNIPYIGIYY
jgi:hypothetical protein